MINSAGSRVWLAPKNANPGQADPLQNALPAQPLQVTRPRPKHYKQETFLNTLLEFSVGLSVLFGIVYGFVQLVKWISSIP